MIYKKGVENLKSFLLTYLNEKMLLSKVVINLRTILNEGLYFIF